MCYSLSLTELLPFMDRCFVLTPSHRKLRLLGTQRRVTTFKSQLKAWEKVKMVKSSLSIADHSVRGRRMLPCSYRPVATFQIRRLTKVSLRCLFPASRRRQKCTFSLVLQRARAEEVLIRERFCFVSCMWTRASYRNAAEVMETCVTDEIHSLTIKTR